MKKSTAARPLLNYLLNNYQSLNSHSAQLSHNNVCARTVSASVSSLKCFKWLKSLSLYFKFVIIRHKKKNQSLVGFASSHSTYSQVFYMVNNKKKNVFESEKTQRRLPTRKSNREISSAAELRVERARGSLLLPKCLSLANVCLTTDLLMNIL